METLNNFFIFLSQVIEKDGFPNQICGECHKQLCLAYKFRRLCENSFKIMLEYVAKFVENSKVKLEKDEFHIFESNVAQTELNEIDVKDEKDFIKGEENLDDDRASPIPDDSILASPLQTEFKNTIKIKEGRRKSNDNSYNCDYLIISTYY